MLSLIVIYDMFCVKDCVDEYPLHVKPKQISRLPFYGRYNETGNFFCSNNGTLVYSNGTLPTSTETRCLGNARWSEIDAFECLDGL